VVPEVCPFIQDTAADTLAYTPGARALAHPNPQDVIPTSSKKFWEFLMTRGPPLSPWQASFPGLAAQIILSVMELDEMMVELSVHLALVRVLTDTF